MIRCWAGRGLQYTLYHQNMTNRRNLLELIYTHGGKMSPEERCRMDALSAIFSSEGPIRPKNIFNLNMASLASTAGLLITYFIVLVQFRAGDG